MRRDGGQIGESSQNGRKTAGGCCGPMAAQAKICGIFEEELV